MNGCFLQLGEGKVRSSCQCPLSELWLVSAQYQHVAAAYRRNAQCNLLFSCNCCWCLEILHLKIKPQCIHYILYIMHTSRSKLGQIHIWNTEPFRLQWNTLQISKYFKRNIYSFQNTIIFCYDCIFGWYRCIENVQFCNICVSKFQIYRVQLFQSMFLTKV